MATKAMSYFRKHQKVILAVVTIGTMLIFIVGDAVQSMGRGGGSGRGGLINWVRNLFGGGEDKDDTLFKVAGRQYTPEQVAQLELKRLFALDVMNSIFELGDSRFLLAQGLTEDDLKDRTKKQQKLAELTTKDPTIREAFNTRQNNLLSQIMPSLTSFEEIVHRIEPPISISEFLLMKAKASELGITVTADSIKDDLIKLGMNKVTVDEMSKIVRENARARGQMDMVKLDNVLNALADEVRVSIAKKIVNEDYAHFEAQQALRSQNIPLPGGPTPPQLTPADLWNTYVNIKTSLSTGILPLKVEDFLSRVADPTQTEKQEFFDKYKKDYPSVDTDTPGFKIPPMYRIGLMFADMKEGSTASKYYRSQVDAWDRVTPLNALADIAHAYDLKKDTTYRSVQPFIEFALTKAANSPWVRVYRWHARQDHAHLAGVLGQLGLAASQVGTFAPGNAFAMTLHGEMVPAQQSDLLQAVKSVAGSTSLMGMLQPFLTQRSGSKDVYTPFSVVAPALIEQRYETKSKEYLTSDLTELTTALNDYGKKYNEWRSKVIRKLIPAGEPPLFNETTKQTLADYLTKFASARSLSYYETKDLRAKDNILVEPAERLLNTFVKPLYYDQSERSTPRQLEDFVRYVLVKDEIRGDKPKLFEATNSSLYDSARKNKEYVLTWVAEASDPRTPDFKEAEPNVVKAWKMAKARPLVEEEAQKIIKDVNAAPDNYRKLFDMKGYTPGQIIAYYTEPELSSTSPMPMYKPAPIPKVLDNPPDDFVPQALDKLKKKGDTAVIPDKSKDVYYLVYLSNRSEPKTSNPADLETFHNEVIRPSMTRQMMIDGTSFRNYITFLQTRAETKGWYDFLMSLTGIKADLFKQYAEIYSRARQGR